jgi:hypothetical protein
MQTAPTLPAPLSNLQLELLKLYSFGISNEEILEKRQTKSFIPTSPLPLSAASHFALPAHEIL